MKAKFLSAVGTILTVICVGFVFYLTLKYMEIVLKMGLVFILSGLFSFFIYLIMERIRLNQLRPFHMVWSFIVVILISLPIWDSGYNMTMLNLEIKPLEEKFLRHSGLDGYSVEYGEMNFGGELDQIILERNALIKKRHAEIIGKWWVNTSTGSHVEAYYRYNFLWWWPKTE